MGAVISAAVLEHEDEQLRQEVPADWENRGRERRQLLT